MSMSDVAAPSLDDRVASLMSRAFPLASRPFHVMGAALGAPEHDVLQSARASRAAGRFHRVAMSFDLEALGCATALVITSPERSNQRDLAGFIALHPASSNVCLREGDVWWHVALPRSIDVTAHVRRIDAHAGARSVVLEPLRWFKPAPLSSNASAEPLSRLEMGAIRALSTDIPLEEEPFEPIAEGLGLDMAALLALAHGFVDDGLARQARAIATAGAEVALTWNVEPTERETAATTLAHTDSVTEVIATLREGLPFNLVARIEAPTHEECIHAAGSMPLDGAVVRPIEERVKDTPARPFAPDLDAWETTVFGRPG
jgi:hypothetical protein